MSRKLGLTASYRVAAPTVALLAVMTSVSLGQTAGATSGPASLQTRAVPLSHIYLHHFRVDDQLEREASRLEEQGQQKRAQEIREHLRSYLQRDLHFTAAQSDTVHRARVQMLQDVGSTWAEAMPIMLQDREWLKQHGRFAGEPPGHAQVDQLQKQMEVRILNDVVELKQELGPSAAARLESYIRAHVAARLITPPRQVTNPGKDYKTSSQYFHQAEAER